MPHLQKNKCINIGLSGLFIINSGKNFKRRKKLRGGYLTLLFWFFVFTVLDSNATNTFQEINNLELSGDYNKKNVLVLNAYHQNYHWADEIMRGVFSELGDKNSYELYIEYMDTKRCSDSIYYVQLKDIYLHKYKNVDIDVILACDDNALNFMLLYRDTIFPKVPVSFCGVVDFHSSRIENQELFTGVYETYDVPANLELIKTLHPEVERVVVVSDVTESGKALIARMKRAEKIFKDRLSIDYLINKEPGEIKNYFKKKQDNTAVIWAIYLRLPDGRFISSEESLGFISSITSVPIYCIWDVVGQGVVGGKITTPYYQGEKAARIAKTIINGEQVSNIEVSGSPMLFKFDYNVLEKHNIPLQAIPEGSVVINKPITFWEANKKIVISLSAIIISLLAVVLALGYLYRKSKRVEIEIKNKNKELEISKIKAEESDRLKTAFLANLSHEIRTPMNGILGFTDLIKSEKLSPDKISQYIDIIDQSGNRLLNLIDDLINISKIEANQVSIKPTNTNLNELLDEICSFFKPQADKKGILITCEKELDDTVNIFIDKLKLIQVLNNLLNNALKFTEKGIINLKYYHSNEYLFFCVKDTGVGIAPNMKHVIFERFLQAEDSYLKETDGMGLGLSISKSFVEKMGGEIWVESEINKGSEFIVKLPFVLPEEDAKKIVKPKLVFDKKINVLVAEDEEVNYLYLMEMLRNENFKIFHAKDGGKAIQLFSEHPQINIILMDLKMPVMNGIDATWEIRKKDPRTPIIALTAYDSDKDRQAAMSAGCTDFITKPVKKDVLLERIALSLDTV